MAKRRGLNGLGSTSLLLLAGGALALWLVARPKWYRSVSEIPPHFLVGPDGKKTMLGEMLNTKWEEFKAQGYSPEKAEEMALKAVRNILGSKS